ncbi:conserved hypothetical protein [Shewanella sediminis HAW-EB3]|uniref:WbqC-like family protein n=1 Tax=Shewanella sediminis (strain HAW-EB3) TaxID=425104 RepID=A8FXM8_SHESH|nr:WbqC family protein [Shewanella sediminis]ABV37601.1 conserved hypothetical protein [Shewanella sediminis HAW-EB3]
MKLGIMQPYLFPYTQQFRHIQQCEQWIVFDTPKYTRKSWINRNRIANPTKEWCYISAPVMKGATTGAISDAVLADTGWRKDFVDQLRVYESKAPFYTETVQLVKACLFMNNKVPTIADLNTHTLKVLCQHLGIDTKITRLSEMNLDLPMHAEPGEWAYMISKELGANIYSNASGGRHLFDPDLYESNGISLEFYEPIPLEFSTPGFSFVPDLSVIDTLMWIGKDNLSQWCKE